MGTLELLLLSLGVAMDAFAASVCKGLAVKRVTIGRMITCGLWFGAFQALMPLLGYLLGVRFQAAIARIDHWIAFVLLGLIGINMIREALSKEEEAVDASFAFRPMLIMAVATSIDALAVGITFAFLQVNILVAASFIGVTTFLLSALGVWIGHLFGARYKSAAELTGGVILILLGIQILLEHLGILG